MQDRPENSEPAAVTEAAKVDFLADSRSHPGVADVEVRETHMAWVFLAGDRALKMKKPVRNRVLDYSTLEVRRQVCEDEVRLNRRLAPDVYLGVEALAEAPDGRLSIGGAGRPVDWLVVMRRLPEARMLDSVIRAGGPSPAQLATVTGLLTRFYRGLTPEPIGPAAYLARFRRVLAGNREVFAAPGFGPLSARGIRVTAVLEAMLDRAPGLLADRVAAGRIVEGHGDLRPEHVCLTEPPVIIDCLEFARELRLVDPFDELCYLGMECAVLGADWIGPVLIDDGAGALGERPAAALLAFYTAFRACFRARQALAHLLEPEPRLPAKWQPLAARYLDRAEAALAP